MIKSLLFLFLSLNLYAFSPKDNIEANSINQKIGELNSYLSLRGETTLNYNISAGDLIEIPLFNQIYNDYSNFSLKSANTNLPCLLDGEIIKSDCINNYFLNIEEMITGREPESGHMYSFNNYSFVTISNGDCHIYWRGQMIYNSRAVIGPSSCPSTSVISVGGMTYYRSGGFVITSSASGSTLYHHPVY